jgi:acyl-CoA oxidase
MIDFHKLSKGNSPLAPLTEEEYLTASAQSQSILVTKFYDALASNTDLPPTTCNIIWDVFRLFASYTLDTDRYECKLSSPLYLNIPKPDLTRSVFTCGAASREQLDALPARVNELMARIRPHAVPLVDAWKIPDYLLDRYGPAIPALVIKRDGRRVY